MLSFLYRIFNDFEHRHGVSPNILYLSFEHYEQLRRSLPGLDGTEALMRHLGMGLILQHDVLHPRVAWRSLRARAG